MMQFVASSSNKPAIEMLVERIGGCLDQGKSVLWLIAGGSAVEIAVEVARRLKGHPNSGQLAVSLTDERYGEVGHEHSNWKQLMDAGFDIPGAELYPVLQGEDMDTTAATFSTWLQRQFAERDSCIGLLGIGADGHTSGILPHSPAVETEELVVPYDGGTYLRVTTTPVALVELDAVVIYAGGAEKQPTLQRLQHPGEIATQPAQLLKQVPEVVIVNDSMEAAL